MSCSWADERLVRTTPRRRYLLWTGGALLTACFLWSYGTTLRELVRIWESEADYSHGFFVLPLAICFLWLRRASFPADAVAPAWSGLVLMALSVALRVCGALFFLDALDGWSVVLWAAGAVWMLGGIRVLRWALPPIAFLLFMIPLPYRIERVLSAPLQTMATWLSSFLLQLLGQPALAEGNTILLGAQQLDVEQSCSGLRIFVGIVALACAWLIVVRRVWWERLILVASAVPIALLANSLRIVATGLLYQYASTETARRFSHDVAGWVMIPLACAMFGVVLWGLGYAVREVRLVDVADLVRHQRIETG